MKFLITGVAGFIGSYFAKYVLQNYPEVSITGLARNTNQKNFLRLEEIKNNPRFKLHFADFAKDDTSELFSDIDYIFHFGAKTFVDFSIQDPEPFIESNIVGTFRLLENARKSRNLKRFHLVSTDEVFGSILTGSYKETDVLNPTNPYSSTKACAEMLTIGYYNTYKVPIIITRTENNFGPYQGIEKAIPVFVKKALMNEPIPVYGDGKHRRQWIHVEDHIRGILHLIEYGKNGEIYNIAGEQELENLELAKRILKILGKPEDMIEFIANYNIRPGHDRRYALNVEKLKATGWAPKYSLDEGLKQTVEWYRDNQWWLL